jgi:16S rRNA processing protein RimM
VDRLLVAQIGKPHGLAGEVYLVPISDDPRRFEPGARLERADGQLLVLEGTRSRRDDRMLAKFQGVNDRAAADALRGPLYVAASDTRSLADDEFWPHDLVGYEVVLVSGEVVGSVARVDFGVAHDLLAVDTQGGERLVPLVKEIVVDASRAKRSLRIDPPAGLVD